MTTAAPAVSTDPTPAPVTPGVPATPAAATPPTPPAPDTPPSPPAPQVIGDPAPTPAAEAADDGQVFTYRETGDVVLDTALDFFGKLGFGPEHPAIVDGTEGKFDKLEAHLSALGDKATGWERYVALAKDAYTRTSAAQATKDTAIAAACTEVAGDEATWNTIKEWAGKEATPEEKQEINQMLAAGPVQARAAALLLTNLYRNAGGTVVTPAPAINPNAGGTPPTNGALSPQEYGQAVRELRAKLGTRMDDSAEYAALRARRVAYRG